MKAEKNILNIKKTRKYLKESKNKRYYPYSGITTFLGSQGSGKTLTAVKEIKELLKTYPKLTFISNVKIEGIENANYYKNCEELVQELQKIDINNNYGYLIFMDERACSTS